MKTHTLSPICLVACAMLAVAGGLLVRASAKHLDTLEEEVVDRRITIGLRNHPLHGGTSVVDASQFRLPMYINAAASWASGRNDMAGFRAVSAVFAGATILAAGALANLLFGPRVGVLASGLLAFSPYFLACSRIAFSGGHVFTACFVTLAICAYIVYLRRPTAGRWIVCAVLLGLAVGTHLFALFLIVVFWVLTVTTYSEPAFKLARMPNHTRLLGRLIVWQLGVIAVTGCLAMLDRYPPQVPNTEWLPPFARKAALVGWIVLAGIWLATIVFAGVFDVVSRSRTARFWGLIGLGVAAFFVLHPVHLLDPSIAREAVFRTITWDGRAPLAMWSDQLRLYSGIVLLKMTWPIGALGLLTLMFSSFGDRGDGRWRPCVFPVLFYAAILCMLPLRQTHYLMPVYPLIMILTAAGMGGITRWVRELRSTPLFGAWIMALLAAMGYFAFDVYRGFPHYHLFGADVVARWNWRWMGAEARGPRNLIQTPGDGVETLMRWIEESPQVYRGARIVAFPRDEALIRSLLPENPRYLFVSRGVSPVSESLESQLYHADFVLLHINNLLGYDDGPGDAPSLDTLNAAFQPVFTVKRGPLEVAWVYGRRETP